MCATAVTAVIRPEAQVRPPGLAPVFRSDVDLVMLPVTVTDEGRRYLTDLESGQFQVFENGRPQQLTFFQRTPTPLALVLMLDTSASMRAVLGEVTRAAAGFLADLDPEDVASVVAFDDRIRVLQQFTNDRAALRTAILGAEPGTSTGLYTALYVALKEFDRADVRAVRSKPRRRVLIVLSDGSDTTSKLPFDYVLETAARADTMIYPIRLDVTPPVNVAAADATRFLLRRLADQTGGRAFFPRTGVELRQVYKTIRADLGSQYVLAYVSNDRVRSGGFRPISVFVNAPGAVARTRRGYFASAR